MAGDLAHRLRGLIGAALLPGAESSTGSSSPASRRAGPRLAGLRTQSILSVGSDGTVGEAYEAGEGIRDILVIGDQVFSITTNRPPRRDGAPDDRLIRFTK